MIFGRLPLDAAEGAVLAHSVRTPHLTLKKGATLGAGEIANLRAAGYTEIVAARLEPGDVAEDEAASAVAVAAAGPGDPTEAGVHRAPQHLCGEPRHRRHRPRAHRSPERHRRGADAGYRAALSPRRGGPDGRDDQGQSAFAAGGR